jgi:hypothetical protein
MVRKIKAAGVSDVKKGLKYLGDLVRILKGLEYIVLVGGPARRAHVYLSHSADVRILGCHHPSPKVVNKYPEMVEENILVFRTMENAQDRLSGAQKGRVPLSQPVGSNKMDD